MKWQKDKSKCKGIQHKLNAALQHTVGIIISDFYFSIVISGFSVYYKYTTTYKNNNLTQTGR